MRFFDALSAVFRDRAADGLCALASHPSAWAGLAMAWLAAWLTAWALVYLAPLAAGPSVAANRRTAIWGRNFAAWWADSLIAHSLPRTAARVRAVNGLAAA